MTKRLPNSPQFGVRLPRKALFCNHGTKSFVSVYNLSWFEKFCIFIPNDPITHKWPQLPTCKTKNVYNRESRLETPNVAQPNVSNFVLISFVSCVLIGHTSNCLRKTAKMSRFWWKRNEVSGPYLVDYVTIYLKKTGFIKIDFWKTQIFGFVILEQMHILFNKRKK